MQNLISLTISFLILYVNGLAQTVLDEKRVLFAQEKIVSVNVEVDTSFKRFTPTSADIDSADDVLQNHFLTIQEKDKYYGGPENYYRQYIGIIVKGRKCVFINASCKKSESFLINTFSPKGGGICFFKQLLTLTRRKYFNSLLMLQNKFSALMFKDSSAFLKPIKVQNVQVCDAREAK